MLRSKDVDEMMMTAWLAGRASSQLTSRMIVLQGRPLFDTEFITLHVVLYIVQLPRKTFRTYVAGSAFNDNIALVPFGYIIGCLHDRANIEQLARRSVVIIA